MSSKIQLHFYKTLIRPIMEYPAIPLCITSKTNIAKVQQFQNRVLRTATRRNEEDNLLSIAELHNKYKVEAINTRLYNLARKVWDKLETIDGELTARSLEENNFPLENDHSWWRRISPYIESRDDAGLRNKRLGKAGFLNTYINQLTCI